MRPTEVGTDTVFPLDGARDLRPGPHAQPLRLHRLPHVDVGVADNEHMLACWTARYRLRDSALFRPRHQVVDEHAEPALGGRREILDDASQIVDAAEVFDDNPLHAKVMTPHLLHELRIVPALNEQAARFGNQCGVVRDSTGTRCGTQRAARPTCGGRERFHQFHGNTIQQKTESERETSNGTAKILQRNHAVRDGDDSSGEARRGILNDEFDLCGNARGLIWCAAPGKAGEHVAAIAVEVWGQVHPMRLVVRRFLSGPRSRAFSNDLGRTRRILRRVERSESVNRKRLSALLDLVGAGVEPPLCHLNLPAPRKIDPMPRDSHGHLVPGRVSGPLQVPPHIARPEYVGKAAPTPFTGSDIYTAEQIDRIRESGRIAADAIALVGESIRPGVTTEELDRIGHQYLIDHGAYPSTLGYRGYPKSLCSSVNEVICHGIPDDTVLVDGDIINIDITAYKNGMHGDTNRTFIVGTASQQVTDLVQRTEEALARGIKAVAVGRRVNVIGRAIESYAQRFGYGVVRDYTGHGVGEVFHSGLVIPHYDGTEFTTLIESGMVFTIEPMLTLGTEEWDVWDDDWTVTTRDKSITAQFEHTIVVTDTGVEVLTLPGKVAA